jgi:DNA-binding NarL/FixJ family response regulator
MSAYPTGNGIELCSDLLSKMPNLRCLMLTSFTSDEAMLDANIAGASGYVVKRHQGDGARQGHQRR